MYIHIPIAIVPFGLFAASIGLAQTTTPVPSIQPNGIVNAASYTHPLLPGGSLAQGTLFTIFGNNLGPAVAPPEPGSFPLGTSLGGVSIAITPAGQGTAVAALPFYVSASQISAILPSNTPLGSNTVVVTYSGRSSAPAAITVVASSAGLFAINSGGFGPSVLQNYVSAIQLPVNSRTVAAKPGQILEMYGTGLGAALNPDNQAPQAGTLPVQTEIFVGGEAAVVAYSGRSPCCSGLDQLVFTLPADVKLGCDVPVAVRTVGTTVSNVVTVAISADGSPCSDAMAPFGNVISAAKSGLLMLVRSTLKLSASATMTVDSFYADFRQETGGAFAFNPIYSAPPPGSCTSYSYAGDVFQGAALPGFAPSGAALDAGFLKVANASTSASAQSPYDLLLGASTSLSGSLPTSFLDSGPFTITGSGGHDVGKFTAKASAAPFVSWSNSTATINRSAGLTATWTFSAPSSGQTVVVTGGNFDSRIGRSAMFFCTAAASVGSFTVPSYILERLPASAADGISTKGELAVIAFPTSPAASFAATGLDQGSIDLISASGQFVTFQ
jgi:uncharacterized protein (TIGR03437 family)